MQLQSLRLENIRSYRVQRIEFPQGTVLLSGDIGSGKSSILAAVEFALFGIKRGELHGYELLRHSSGAGSVELTFSLDGKEITIKRTLKRSKDDVKQDSGYLIVDGVKREGTPVELKAWIYELLGYPMDLLSKSKDLVYRYTVYTPQEQMKQILYEDPETRLDTLRRVFDVDKYKRIRENVLVVVKNLREQLKKYEGMIADLPQKEQQLSELKEKVSVLTDKIVSLTTELEQKKKDSETAKQAVSQAEEKVASIRETQTTFAGLKAELTQKQQLLQQLTDRIVKMSQDLDALKDVTAPSMSLEALQEDLAKRRADIQTQEEQAQKHVVEIGKLTASMETSKKLLDTITSLTTCPTCMQNVEDSHKKHITEDHEQKISNSTEQMQQQEAQKKELSENIALMKQGVDKIQEKLAQLSGIQVRLETKQRLEKEVQEVMRQKEKLHNEVQVLQKKVSGLETQISGVEALQQAYLTAKKQYDAALLAEKDVTVTHGRSVQEQQTLQSIEKTLVQEIADRKTAEQNLKKVTEKIQWLQDTFTPVMSTMEKHIMTTLVQEFNSLFKEWFGMLLEDDQCVVSVDDQFTPLVQQQGYDVSFSQLSGGEKTSLALAYRLSLNHVINNLLTTIKTRDMLILDEPTDGFSTEQLDKVRDVLQQLTLNQIIIVSHEQKLESFVDNVIRITKRVEGSEIA